MVGSVEDYRGIAKTLHEIADENDEGWHGQQPLCSDSGLIYRPSPLMRRRQWRPEIVVRNEQIPDDEGPYPSISSPAIQLCLASFNPRIERKYRW